jgi:hypothetical protein
MGAEASNKLAPRFYRVPGATIEQAFQQASSVPFSLILNDELADNEEGVDLSAEVFVDFGSSR